MVGRAVGGTPEASQVVMVNLMVKIEVVVNLMVNLMMKVKE